MNKYCINRWEKNKHHLRNAIKEISDFQLIDYMQLFQLCVKYILNTGAEEQDRYKEQVICIEIGGYSGDYVFVILPENEYQGVDGVLMSYVEYGSCSGCDMMENIVMEVYKQQGVTEQIIDDVMMLCQHMICNTIKPYNHGRYNDMRFNTIEEYTYNMSNICDLKCIDLGNGIYKVEQPKINETNLKQWISSQTNLVFLIRDDYSEILAVGDRDVEDVGIKLREYAKELGIEDYLVYVCLNTRGIRVDGPIIK